VARAGTGTDLNPYWLGGYGCYPSGPQPQGRIYICPALGFFLILQMVYVQPLEFLPKVKQEAQNAWLIEEELLDSLEMTWDMEEPED
jgi:hypothetical protein